MAAQNQPNVKQVGTVRTTLWVAHRLGSAPPATTAQKARRLKIKSNVAQATIVLKAPVHHPRAQSAPILKAKVHLGLRAVSSVRSATSASKKDSSLQ